MSDMGTSMTVVRQARDLVAGGWSAEEAARVLAREGINVSGRSIRRWTSTKQYARDLESVRRSQGRKRAKTATFLLRSTTPEYKEAFIRRLLAEGVPRSSIAKVCTVVFAERMSRYDVLCILGER